MTRIILLDDRPQDRFLARRALESEFSDLSLTEIRDRAEFESALEQIDADVIITDYQLRWTDGLQVLADVRAKGLAVPVVMFTHTGSEEIAAAGLRAGLADYIVKTPTHLRRLSHAVRIALQNAAAARNERQARVREREALRTAEEALRLKDEFLATLSHELRTPLNAISGWLQIIKSQPDPQRLDRGLIAIERNTALLTRLITDLVDVSRIVSGTLTLHVQPTDIRKVVEAALDSVRPAIQAKQLHVQIVEGRGTSLLEPVAADPDRLQQIVWNLLSNAVKFTPAGGRITIAVRRARDVVEMSVTDTGCGIRPDFLPRIFDRFSQQDAGTTREHGGMGLGLAIVRHLAEMHGGSVSAASTEGCGATFTVRIPIAPAPKVRSASREVDRLQLGGLRVLVVDDDQDAREVLDRMLQDLGADVAAAESAADGYEILSHWRADVLVCDIGMPTEDGVSFVGRIRRDPDARISSTPAVALTAYARDQDRERSLGAGFQAHLVKPFTMTELAGAIRQLAHLNDEAYQPSSGV